MIRSHKWEWGPPTHRRHPALLCHRCTMPPQTQLRLLNLTGFSLPISLHPSPFKTTASLWTTGKTQNMRGTHAEDILVVVTSLLYRVAQASCPQLFPFGLGDQGERQQGTECQKYVCFMKCWRPTRWSSVVGIHIGSDRVLMTCFFCLVRVTIGCLIISSWLPFPQKVGPDGISKVLSNLGCSVIYLRLVSPAR